jgi:epoxyqueuosine reductase QueG
MLSPEERVGVSVAVRLPKEVIASIHDGPNRAYFDMYHEKNARLDEIVLAGEKIYPRVRIQCACPNTSSVKEYGVYRTRMPHKTVAVRAGLGWIGKSALFVNERYGSAVRLSSILPTRRCRPAFPLQKQMRKLHCLSKRLSGGGGERSGMACGVGQGRVF